MAVARFTVAIDRPSRDGKKEADFPNVIVFGKQAENCGKYTAKGKLIGIEGRIQTGSYTNRDGNKIYTTDVVANRVEFIEWANKDAEPKQEQFSGFQPVNESEIPF